MTEPDGTVSKYVRITAREAFELLEAEGCEQLLVSQERIAGTPNHVLLVAVVGPNVLEVKLWSDGTGPKYELVVPFEPAQETE